MRMFNFHYGRETTTLRTAIPGGFVYIFLKDGTLRTFNWLGGIDSEVARRTPDAKPVKIYCTSYATGKGLAHRWLQLHKDEALVGCLFNGGVYAVLYQGDFRVVARDVLIPPPQRGKLR